MAKTPLNLLIILSLVVGSFSTPPIFQGLHANQSKTLSNTTTILTLGCSKVILRSSDDDVFEVDEAVAIQSKTIKQIIENDQISDDGILLPNITTSMLTKVIEYSEKHLEVSKNSSFDIQKWDSDFVKVDHSTLFGLVFAANELQLKGLLDLSSNTIGDMMKGKSVQEIREMFNITDDCIANENSLKEDKDLAE